jgi:hypothetical protein
MLKWHKINFDGRSICIPGVWCQSNSKSIGKGERADSPVVGSGWSLPARVGSSPRLCARVSLGFIPRNKSLPPTHDATRVSTTCPLSTGPGWFGRSHQGRGSLCLAIGLDMCVGVWVCVGVRVCGVSVHMDGYYILYSAREVKRSRGKDGTSFNNLTTIINTVKGWWDKMNSPSSSARCNDMPNQKA